MRCAVINFLLARAYGVAIADEADGLNAVTALNTRRSDARALDDLLAFTAGRPLTRALLQRWKASMDSLASTVNVKLAAARRLVSQARPNGLIWA